jgi:hypothetical protein
MPPREEGNSPEMHVNKKVRTDEVPPLVLTQDNIDPVITQNSAVPDVPIPVESLPRREPNLLDSNLLDTPIY